MIIVFLGPPASGKGTQADMLNDDHGFFHFDTGSRLRAEVATGRELGARIAQFTDVGRLVPLEIIKDLIFKFVREADAERIMFDGFPRNRDQAQVLDEALKECGDDLDFALYLEIDEDNLVERIVNRRFCPQCGEIYNLIGRPPREPGLCDNDGAKLIQRKDDTEEVFSTRLKVYAEETIPVLDYYRERGLLHTIDADKDIDEVSRAIVELLGV